jgi:hypothetical protein
MGQKEKLMKQGLMVEKSREREALEIKIDRCVKDLEYYAFPFDGIASIEPGKVLQAAQELKTLCGRWRDLNGEIDKLDKEL